MTAGMQHRQQVLDWVEDEDLEYIEEAEINEAIGMLNTGKGESWVFDLLVQWNSDIEHEALCESRAARDFEERAYGRD